MYNTLFIPYNTIAIRMSTIHSKVELIIVVNVVIIVPVDSGYLLTKSIDYIYRTFNILFLLYIDRYNVHICHLMFCSDMK